jgi:nucleoside-diphosphate-sugar epimerase
MVPATINCPRRTATARRGLTAGRTVRPPCGVRILIAGGSGLIGARVAEVLRERGHEVTSVARTARPGVDHAVDLGTAPVDVLGSLLAGHDGVVFAARTDEQRPLPSPILPVMRRDMVDPVTRLFTAARLQGLSRGAIMGSYYTYFDRVHPGWQLPVLHPYVQCRVEQAQEARSAAGADLPVAVVELPFVAGRAGGRLPNWAPPLDRWARSRAPLFVPAGGTAVVSVSSVAALTADALEQASGADLPVADENLPWRDLIGRIAATVGRGRKVGRLPGPALHASLRLGGALQTLARKESGLDPAHFADLLLADLFIEPTTGRPLEPALRDTFPA